MLIIKIAELYPKQFTVEVSNEEEERIWNELYAKFKIRCRVRKWQKRAPAMT